MNPLSAAYQLKIEELEGNLKALQDTLEMCVSEIEANGYSFYKCPLCDKTVARESHNKTIKSICMETGEEAVLNRVNITSGANSHRD